MARQANDAWNDNPKQEDLLVQSAKMFSHLDLNRLAGTLEGHPLLQSPRRNENAIYQHLAYLQREGRIVRG